ncbi:hypothetical protein BKA70DRAFT_1294707 [Coprinopsis sp. MPI-PUGE-AT-0042]|nr:hypothetical protein BKA70DRAFT_1352345 [Coprinopsis sp. MPI-PUGE-AT-0042]KAH6905018.1 hypothetical protein BKA70DRAFT_1294707 [Coprinopsis sp. MPI-PUGE-AT-0042]
MSDSNTLIYYDISSPIQPRTYAPNPSKGRLALNFKGVPFTTKWIEILDIADVRKSLNCPATRKLDDGSDFFTLPMLQIPASGKVLGDTFDIANYLDDTFPDSGAGRLFPPDSTRTGLDYESPAKDTPFYAPVTTNEGSKNADYAKFNLHVDTTFSANLALFGEYLPFNPSTAEATKALFAKRAHINSWDDLSIHGEARGKLMVAFREATASLAQLFTVHGGGPYLEGAQANYADLIVGGWLNMLSVVMPDEEWQEFRTWHGGVLAKLHDALQENYFESK